MNGGNHVTSPFVGGGKNTFKNAAQSQRRTPMTRCWMYISDSERSYSRRRNALFTAYLCSNQNAAVYTC